MKIKRYFSSLGVPDINYYRVIHSFKTALACLIGLGIEEYFGWPSGHWIPITTMVVMSAQKHFGGAVHKAFMRFLGTFGGVLLAIIALWLFGDHIVVVFCTIFIASIIFAYIASSHGDIGYAGTLGGVTILVILTSKHAGMEVAVQRGFYIFIGIVIALLVSRFVYPIHARDRFRYHVAATLRNLSRLYFLAIQMKETPEDKSTELSLTITNDIVSQPRLIHEAVVGSRAFAAKKPIFNEILKGEQNLSRLINLMHVNLREASESIDVERELETVAKLHSIIGDGLTYMADCFEAFKQPKTTIDFKKALVDVTYAVEKMPKLEGAQQLIMSHSFLFFMEQILKESANMRELIAKVNGKSKESVV